eukprot:COSAG02_NODE_9794_length_2109_cov_1.378607_3_plen_109_part_00
MLQQKEQQGHRRRLAALQTSPRAVLRGDWQKDAVYARSVSKRRRTSIFPGAKYPDTRPRDWTNRPQAWTEVPAVPTCICTDAVSAIEIDCAALRLCLTKHTDLLRMHR